MPLQTGRCLLWAAAQRAAAQNGAGCPRAGSGRKRRHDAPGCACRADQSFLRRAMPQMRAKAMSRVPTVSASRINRLVATDNPLLAWQHGRGVGVGGWGGGPCARAWSAAARGASRGGAAGRLGRDGPLPVRNQAHLRQRRVFNLVVPDGSAGDGHPVFCVERDVCKLVVHDCGRGKAGVGVRGRKADRLEEAACLLLPLRCCPSCCCFHMCCRPPARPPRAPPPPPTHPPPTHTPPHPPTHPPTPPTHPTHPTPPPPTHPTHPGQPPPPCPTPTCCIRIC